MSMGYIKFFYKKPHGKINFSLGLTARKNHYTHARGGEDYQVSIQVSISPDMPRALCNIHPDLKRTLVTISERTGMSVSQVTDEVLYKGLVGMQEMDELE